MANIDDPLALANLLKQAAICYGGAVLTTVSTPTEALVETAAMYAIAARNFGGSAGPTKELSEEVIRLIFSMPPETFEELRSTVEKASTMLGKMKAVVQQLENAALANAATKTSKGMPS